MKTWTRRGFLAAVLIGGALPALGQLVGFATSPLVIETADGRRHSFTVELALTDQQQMQGLMYRRALAPDRGGRKVGCAGGAGLDGVWRWRGGWGRFCSHRGRISL